MFVGFFRYPRLHNLHVVIEETKGMFEVHQFIFKFTYEKQRGLEHVYLTVWCEGTDSRGKEKKQLVLSTVVALYRGWMMDKYDKMEKNRKNVC